MQSIIGAAHSGIRVSSVIDIPVNNGAESSRIVNWIAASLNSRSPEQGYASMTSQYLEPENMIRVMLWGSPSLITT